jgi:hypothetical protein
MNNFKAGNQLLNDSRTVSQSGTSFLGALKQSLVLMAAPELYPVTIYEATQGNYSIVQ